MKLAFAYQMELYASFYATRWNNGMSPPLVSLGPDVWVMNTGGGGGPLVVWAFGVAVGPIRGKVRILLYLYSLGPHL